MTDRFTRRTLLKGSLPVVLGVEAIANAGCKAALPSGIVDAGDLASLDASTPRGIEGYDVYLLRSEEGVAALSGKCPHRACAVRLADDIDGFRCRCHGSEFASDGTVQEGPADRDLTWLAVEVTSDGQLRVDPSREVPKGTYTPV